MLIFTIFYYSFIIHSSCTLLVAHVNANANLHQRNKQYQHHLIEIIMQTRGRMYEVNPFPYVRVYANAYVAIGYVYSSVGGSSQT